MTRRAAVLLALVAFVAGVVALLKGSVPAADDVQEVDENGYVPMAAWRYPGITTGQFIEWRTE